MTDVVIQVVNKSLNSYPKTGEWAGDYCYEAAKSFEEVNFWDRNPSFKIHVMLWPLGDDVSEPRGSAFRKDVIYVGSIEFLKMVARRIGFSMPFPLNIPTSIESYAGRQISYGKIKDITSYPVFIKPADELKLFPGGVISHEPSLTIPELKEDTRLLISEVVDFVSEYRCFVFKGKLVGVRHYSGSFYYYPEIAIIENCIHNYFDAPVAYCIDFGITSDGKTMLVEVNDFWSCGTYGFTGQTYAYMLVNRWREIIKTSL